MQPMTFRARVWSRDVVWVWCLVVGAALVGGLFVVQVLSDWDGASDLYYSGVSLLAVVGIVAGIVLHRPVGLLPWVLLAVGQLSYTVADVAFFVSVVTETERFPGVPDVFYLAQFPLVISALAVFIRRRTPGWHAPTWIDAAVLGTAASLVWWVYMIEPVASGPELGRAALAVTVAYPVLDLLMLAMALRLMLGGGNRPAAFRLLVLSLVAMLIGDGVYTVQTVYGSWVSGGWVDGVWLVSYVLGAAAALHPSMRVFDAKAPAAPPSATVRRLSVLAAASLLAPTVLLVQYVRADRGDEPVIAVSCMVLFLLVLARMAGLVSAQRYTAITDGLTGLRTRGSFTESLGLECARVERSGHSIGLIIVDVDHFKRVNDTWGHPAGDAVLVEVGQRLRLACRENDVIGRYGGEEFAVLLPGAGEAEIAAVGERIRAAIAVAPVVVNAEVAVAVTVSVGAACAAGRWAQPQSLIHAADAALYRAKHQGRDQVVTTTPPESTTVTGMPATSPV